LNNPHHLIVNNKGSILADFNGGQKLIKQLNNPQKLTVIKNSSILVVDCYEGQKLFRLLINPQYKNGSILVVDSDNNRPVKLSILKKRFTHSECATLPHGAVAATDGGR